MYAKCSLASPSTHYPSWGSGTTIDRSSSATLNPSLPLMGIRNENVRAESAGS